MAPQCGCNVSAAEWTRQQWSLCSLQHMKRARAFSAVRGGDTLFPNDFGEDLLLHSILTSITANFNKHS